MAASSNVEKTRMNERMHCSAAATLTLLSGLLLSGCTTPQPSVTPSESSNMAVSAAFHFQAEPLNCEEPGHETLSSVVRVASTDGADASGVVIARNRVLTAAHVLDDHIQALVYVDATYQQATVIARDSANDLVILDTPTGFLTPIRISTENLFSAEPVWTVGFPLALEQTANFGRYQQHVNGAIHSTASTNAGASGGGLLRCTGGNFELAGMIRGYGAYWDAGELRRIEDLSISVPADTISAFVVNAGVGL
ncbi:MAG: serine protease [Gammaproteobacteria bacterium]